MAKTTNEQDRANEKPAPAAPLAPAPATATTAARPAGDVGTQESKPAAEFTATAFSERLPEARPDADRTADAKAAEAKVAPLQKEYDGLLEKIRETVDPQARAQLVNRKGHVTREIVALRRASGTA